MTTEQRGAFFEPDDPGRKPPQHRKEPEQPQRQRHLVEHRLADDEGGDPARLQLVGGALRHDIGALPIIAPVQLDDEGAGAERAAGLVVIAGALGQAEPEHVDRRAEIVQRQPGLPAQHRAAPVRGDGEQPRPRLAPVGKPHAGDPAALLDQVDRLGVHRQREGRIELRLLAEEIEEVPLRHQGDEPAFDREVAEVGDRDPRVGDPRGQMVDLVVRPPQELLQEAELVHQLQRRGMDGVAAEIAQEIAMLLEHERGDAGPREQQPRHHPRRPAAGDHEVVLGVDSFRFRHSGLRKRLSPLSPCGRGVGVRGKRTDRLDADPGALRAPDPSPSFA
jgi:hypothetical protein